jgi:hypothetical protein
MHYADSLRLSVSTVDSTTVTTRAIGTTNKDEAAEAGCANDARRFGGYRDQLWSQAASQGSWDTTIGHETRAVAAR